MKTYPNQEVEEKLTSIEGWSLVNKASEKLFKFKDFKQALAFIVQVGMVAEQADHHPEIFNVYNKVTLRLNTHSANGITDKDFDLAVKYCLQNTEQITLFIGTHNEQSNMLATETMQSLAIPNATSKVYFSQLYGMSDNISFNLANAGYQVSKYLPYGPVEDVIPYLMRRAEENTSVAGQTGRELGLIRKELERRKLKA